MNREPGTRNPRFAGLWFAAALAVAVAAANALVAGFVRAERTVYSCDPGGYWALWIQYAQDLRAWPRGGLVQLLHSIDQLEYNYLVFLPIAPVAWLAGAGRVAYVLAVLNAYLLPAGIALVLLLAWRFGGPRLGLSGRLALAVLVLLCAPLYCATLRGYPDVAGLLGVLAILFLCPEDLYTTWRPGRAALLGGLILGTVFLRRWYAYWAVGYLVALGLTVLASVAAQRERRGPRVGAFALNMLVVAAVGGGVLALAFPGFLARGLGVDYREVYSAYRFGGLAENALRPWRYFGPGLWCLAAVGFVTALRAERRRRDFALVTAGSAAIGSVLFFRAQSMNDPHEYLVAANLLLLAGLAVVTLWERLGGRAARLAALGAVLVYAALGWAAVYTPRPSWPVRALASVLPGIRGTPLVRHDLPALRSLVDELRRLTAARPDEYVPVYVLASSDVLAEDILRRVEFPGCLDALPTCQTSFTVDKRDGFPHHFLLARYVVVGEPVQYHLRPADQQLVGALAAPILTGTGLGRAYRRVSERTLDGGVKAVVFEKAGPYELDDVRTLAASLRAAYPGHSKFGAVQEALFLVERLQPGARGGRISITEDGRLFVHPGSGSPSRFVVRLDGRYARLRLKTGFDNLAELRRRPPEQGEVDLRLRADGREAGAWYVTRQEPPAVDVDVTGVLELAVEVGEGRFGSTADWFVLERLQVEEAVGSGGAGEQGVER
jgi:hypothetical protein